MPIIEPVIRPPQEATSFLLQVTTGCSANHCSFCAAYAGKIFSIKSDREIFQDIEDYKNAYGGARRVFLMDGDALAAKNEKLVPVLEKLQESFPNLARVSSYANGFNISVRSDEELKELYDNKLRMVYMGLESGSQKVLSRCGKRATRDEMIEAVRRLEACGIKSSVIVLLGLGGKEASTEHVRGTIEALNKMQPRYLSFLTVMFIPGTPLYAEAAAKKFTKIDILDTLREARDIIKGLDLKKTIFRSNHSSNYLPLKGRLPKDKERLIEGLQQGIDGEIDLTAEGSRGL